MNDIIIVALATAMLLIIWFLDEGIFRDIRDSINDFCEVDSVLSDSYQNQLTWKEYIRFLFGYMLLCQFCMAHHLAWLMYGVHQFFPVVTHGFAIAYIVNLLITLRKKFDA